MKCRLWFILPLHFDVDVEFGVSMVPVADIRAATDESARRLESLFHLAIDPAMAPAEVMDSSDFNLNLEFPDQDADVMV